MSEGSRHFEEKSAVFAALEKITRRLNALGIPYALVGGMALFRHGLRRFTEDVVLLVTKEDLKRIHHELEGRGYLPPHRHSKHLRDTELGVRIEFLTTGEFPGDGKPKPVAFPDPGTVSIDQEGVKVVNLPTLIELKLASGMTNSNRLKDLGDVQELIKTLDLPAEFAEKLHTYVREKYRELWSQGRKRFVTIWRSQGIAPAVSSLEELVASVRQAADRLEAMRRDGVILSDDQPGGDSLRLITTDPAVARKFDMVEESEFWSEGENEDADDASETTPTQPPPLEPPKL